MRLQSLYLQNFRKISSQQLPEPAIVLHEDINVLVGANNTGKTSILRAIQKVLNTATLEPNDFNFLLEDGNLDIKGDMRFSANEWQTFLKIAGDRQIANGNAALLDEQMLVRLSKKLSKQTVSFYRNAVFANRRILNHVVRAEIDFVPANTIERSLVADIQAFLTNANFYDSYKTPLYLDSKGDIAEKERFMPLAELEKPSAIGQNRIRGLLYALKKKSAADFEDFKSRLLTVFTEIEDIDVVHNEEIGEFELRIIEKMRDNGTSKSVAYDIKHTGQGMQSLALMLSAILLLKPRIVLMDEPEVHMHPTLIRDFTRYIKQLSANTQFIMTTHSLVLMQEMGLDKVFLLTNEAKGVRIHQAVEANGWQEVIQNLGYTVDILNYTLQPKVLVFVEGDSDKKYLLAFAVKAGLSHAINEKNTAFVNMQGKGDRYKLANLIQKLQEGVLTSPWLMVLDRDEMKPKEIAAFREKYFSSYPNRLHYFGKRQIENYLTDATAIKKLVAGKIKDDSLRQYWEQTDLQTQLLQLCETQKEDVYENFAADAVINGTIIQIKEIRELIKQSGSQNITDFAAALNSIIFRKALEIGKNADSMRNFFEQEWAAGKLDMCDGRKLLKNLRQWVEKNFRVSFTDDEIIDKMEVLPKEIAELLNKIINTL
ncbi:ATP-dependent nuclease [Rhodoflexus sp.]